MLFLLNISILLTVCDSTRECSYENLLKHGTDVEKLCEKNHLYSEGYQLIVQYGPIIPIRTLQKIMLHFRNHNARISCVILKICSKKSNGINNKRSFFHGTFITAFI